MKNLLITLIFVFLFYTPSFACKETIAVHGRVLQQTAPDTYAPISGAKVQNDIYFGYSNPFGFYSFTVPNCGTRTFTATKKGFSFDPQTFTLPIPDLTVLNIDFVAK